MKMTSISTILVILLFGFTKTALSTNNNDEVTDLPGLNFRPNFRHYSGYLEAENGVFLHYWLFESQHDPHNDPVVFWFNGGPGGSSLVGAFTEHGPFRVHYNGTLSFNKFSWNNQANMIYVESPAGVGFSYKLDKNYTTDDNLVAKNNYAAIKSFFKKYPHFEKNNFYISGESYGGIYVPTLSVLVHEHKYPKNFKGFIVGNGLLDYELNDNSQLHYYYHHGRINDDIWVKLLTTCCPNINNTRYCNFAKNSNKQCNNMIEKIMNVVQKSFVNRYNIYDECFNDLIKLQYSPMVSKSYDEGWITSLLFKNNEQMTSCKSSDSYTSLTNWLNQNSVRKALHVSEKVRYWKFFNDKLEYKRNYYSMKKQIKQLLDAGLKGLIYNGDFDSVCNYLGDRWFVEELNYKPDSDYEAWYYNDHAGGFQIKYGKLIYKTIFAAGHMVPMDQAGPAQKMFNEFLEL